MQTAILPAVSDRDIATQVKLKNKIKRKKKKETAQLCLFCF